MEVSVETHANGRLIDPNNVLERSEFLVETLADSMHIWHVPEEFVLRFGA